MMTSSTNFYGYYTPSAVAAIIVAVIFLILAALQLLRIITSRRWFGFALVTGCLFEVVGLAARAYSHSHLSERAPYIIQVLLILLAPILFSASVYMFLGRLIHASGHPELSFIRINWLTKIFVVGDIFCFLVQAAGAGKLVNAKTNSTVTTAQNIILGGLGLQVLFFFVFALCAIVFHVRSRQPRVKRSLDPRLCLDTMLLTLYLCSLLITVRNIYRLIEYKSGTTGYLQEHEWPAYGLDVILMAIITAVTLSWYSVRMDNRISGGIPLNLNYGQP